MKKINLVEANDTCGNCIFRMGLEYHEIDPENYEQGYTELCDLIGGVTKRHFEACSDYIRRPDIRSEYE